MPVSKEVSGQRSSGGEAGMADSVSSTSDGGASSVSEGGSGRDLI